MSNKVKQLKLNLALVCTDCLNPVDESFSFCPHCGRPLVLNKCKYRISAESKFFREHVTILNNLLMEYQASIKASKLVKHSRRFQLYNYNPESLDGRFNEIPLFQNPFILYSVTNADVSKEALRDYQRSAISSLVKLHSNYPDNIKIYINRVDSKTIEFDVYYVFDDYAIPFDNFGYYFKEVCTLSSFANLISISNISKYSMSRFEYWIQDTIKDVERDKEILKYERIMYKLLKDREVK